MPLEVIVEVTGCDQQQRDASLQSRVDRYKIAKILGDDVFESSLVNIVLVSHGKQHSLQAHDDALLH